MDDAVKHHGKNPAWQSNVCFIMLYGFRTLCCEQVLLFSTNLPFIKKPFTCKTIDFAAAVLRSGLLDHFFYIELVV